MRNIYTIVAKDLKSMSRTQHFLYWVFPMTLLSILMAFFFSGIPELMEIVNPKMNREWGLIENIQLGIIAVMISISAYASHIKIHALQKWGFLFVSIFAVFVFLEEIDYGAHIVKYFTGVGESQLDKLTGVYNIHNYGHGTAKIIKRSVYVLMLIMFIISPLLTGIVRNRVVSYLIPKPKIMILAILTVLVEIIARLLMSINNLRREDLSMEIGEFSEIMIYYIFLIYLMQLIFEKDWTIIGSSNSSRT